MNQQILQIQGRYFAAVLRSGRSLRIILRTAKAASRFSPLRAVLAAKQQPFS